jgi:hypothetical protein
MIIVNHKGTKDTLGESKMPVSCVDLVFVIFVFFVVILLYLSGFA